MQHFMAGPELIIRPEIFLVLLNPAQDRVAEQNFKRQNTSFKGLKQTY